MTAYLIAIRERTRRRDDYLAYKEMAPLEINGSPLVRLTAEKFEVLEGADAEAVSIIAFASYDDARAWYESDSYRKALERRLQGTDFRLLLVNGADAERPSADQVHARETMGEKL